MKTSFLATLFSFLFVLVSQAQVLTLNKAAYAPGEAITATWSGRTSPSKKDWVGVYPAGVTPGVVVSTLWNYTSSKTHTSGATASTAGSMTFSAPGLAVGNWTAYFLSDDTYTSLSSVNFTVAAASTFSFSLNKSAYQSGESITATWANRSSAAATDTIGIYPQGVVPGSGTTATLWKYTSGTQTAGPPLAGGSVSFSSPGLPAGNWTAWFLDSGGNISLGSVNFTIAAAPVSFSLNKQLYQVGESMTVTWSGRTGPSATDWVGIYPRNLSGVPDGSPGSTIWNYTSGTGTAGMPLADGSFTFTNPGLPKGDWTAYFLAADGYQILGTFEFSVANSPRILGFTADHAFLDDGGPIALSWVVDPGDGVVQSLTVGSGGTQTDVSALDVLEVSPLQTTTYTLTLNGTLTAQAQVFKDAGNTSAFSIDASHLSTGSTLNAVWNGVTGNPDSWVAIYRMGDQPGPNTAVYWYYLNGTKTIGGSLTGGSLAFNPAAGDYYAVLFTNGGYTIEQGPIRFSVVSGAIKPLAVAAFARDGDDMRLDWNSLPNESYDILTSPDLSTWNVEVENVRASSLSSSVFLPITPADPQRFYRVRLKGTARP